MLDVRVDGRDKDPIVYGIEHDKNVAEKVRLAETHFMQHGSGSGVYENALKIYIDLNNDGNFDSKDEPVLGYVAAEVLSGSTTVHPGLPIKKIVDISNAGGSYTTAQGDHGEILFRVISGEKRSIDNTIAVTTLNINVK
ncbi:hypothetical protein [Bacillus testis]|uniref:hypothetical protein n=1 Tax=Bacillus testis TaxID=1622072 RepID=UPI00067F2FBF|nr:hypothetical protein [Bacillus testis]